MKEVDKKNKVFDINKFKELAAEVKEFTRKEQLAGFTDVSKDNNRSDKESDRR